MKLLATLLQLALLAEAGRNQKRRRNGPVKRKKDGQRRSDRQGERSNRWLDHKKCLNRDNIKRSVAHNANGEGMRVLIFYLENIFSLVKTIFIECCGYSFDKYSVIRLTYVFTSMTDGS